MMSAPHTDVEVVSPHLSAVLSIENGLRIRRLSRIGVDENILGEFPDVQWDTPWGSYQFGGGHRLWLAPERQPDVCEPESKPAIERDSPSRARLTHGTPSPSGLVKSLEVELLADSPALTVRHRVENRGAQSKRCALWALTMLDLSGVVVVPHEPAPLEGLIYTPNRVLVAWPYTSLTDARLTLGADHLAWDATPGPAWKLGTFSRRGQIAYARGDVMLEKRITPEPDADHADDGCNLEVYSNDRFAEIETLSPLIWLEPGAGVEHVEHWCVHTLADTARAGVDTLLTRLQEGILT